MARLVVESGPDAGREFPLGDVAVIGRLKTAQVPLTDASASREHTRVLHQGSDWFLVDLGSRNGTQVNGNGVQRHKLSQGDRIAIGKTVMRFEPDGAPAAKEEKKEATLAAAAPPKPSAADRLAALSDARRTPETKPLGKEKRALSADKVPLAANAREGVALSGTQQAMLVLLALLVAGVIAVGTWWVGTKVFGKILEKPVPQRK